MIYRNASIDDVDSCLVLSSQQNEKYWTKKDFVNCINNSNCIFIVAEEERNLLGYVIGYIVPTKCNEAMVHESRVDINKRGKKIGTKLVQEFCNEAFSKGANVVYALIESKLKPFYVDSCDFKETGKWIETSKKIDTNKL